MGLTLSDLLGVLILIENTRLHKNEVHLSKSLIVKTFIHGTILTEL